MNETKSKQERVKDWLVSGNDLTPLEALNMFGTFRLSAIIYNLIHKEGLRIIKLDTGKQYATYHLVKEGELY